MSKNKASIVCPISAGGYLHAGSLRRILAARKLADKLEAKLILRFDDCYSTCVEPDKLFRNILRGINVSFSLSYLRRSLRECGIQYDDIVRTFEILPDIRKLMGDNLRTVATSIITAGEFRNDLILDGVDPSIVTDMWLLPDDAEPVAYKLQLGDISVLLEELYGYPGEIVAGLFADQLMDVSYRFIDTSNFRITQLLEPIMSKCYADMREIEDHPIQAIRFNSQIINEDEYWICKEPEPDLAVCRLVQMYGKDSLLTALNNSLDEDENDWETISNRWLSRSYLIPRCCPRHLRFQDENIKCETSLHNVPKCKDNMLGPPRIRFAPSASGYLHVGNLRTLIACRDLADSLGGQLYVRIDDDHHECMEQTYRILASGLVRAQLATSTQYIIQCLKACGIRHDAVYLLSDAAPAVMSLVCPTLATMPNDIHTIARDFSEYANSKSFRHLLEELQLYLWNPCSGSLLVNGPVGVLVNSISLYRFDGMPAPPVNGVVSDTIFGITHTVRGEDLLCLPPLEDYIYAHMPWLHPIENHFVPLLKWDSNVISKSRYNLDFEPETSVLNSIARYGSEKLICALRLSLEYGVNEWEEIKDRWLE